MLHVYIARFDVMDTVALFWNLGWKLNTGWGNLGQVNRVDFEPHTVHDTWQESLKFSFFTSPSLLGRAAEHWCTCK